MKGTLIVFDGVDGSGKGTMVREAHQFLLQKGVLPENILLTAEPTRGYFGKKVRELLDSQINPNLNAQQFLDLYLADRKEHVEKEIIPALAAGKIILCDRYKYSTFVYQQLQGIPLEKIQNLHEGMPVPDLVFILDLSVDAALKRIARRKKTEVFEHRRFLEKVRIGFLELQRVFPKEEIVFIDASRSIKEVSSRIGTVLSAKLEL